MSALAIWICIGALAAVLVGLTVAIVWAHASFEDWLREHADDPSVQEEARLRGIDLRPRRPGGRK